MLSDKTVLIVDDEVELAEIIGFQAEEAGFKVKLAHSGEDAWKIIQDNQVDAVVTDVRMPNGDGVELLEKIRQRDRQKPPVIMISGFTDITAQGAVDAGAVALLKKPMDLVKIIPMLEQVVG